jgi:hypothetical protein
LLVSSRDDAAVHLVILSTKEEISILYPSNFL